MAEALGSDEDENKSKNKRSDDDFEEGEDEEDPMDDDEEDDDGGSDEDDFQTSKKKKKKKSVGVKKRTKPKKRNADGGSDVESEGEILEKRFKQTKEGKSKKVHKGSTTGRERTKVVSYVNSSDSVNESDIASDYEEVEEVVVDIDVIDMIMDHR